MIVPGWLNGARGLRADLIALAAGALAALALPPLFVLPVLLVSFPILLALINASERGVLAARRGWWFGFGYHLIGLYWITEAILFESARFWWLVPLAVPGVSAVLAVFIAAPAWVAWYCARTPGPNDGRPDGRADGRADGPEDGREDGREGGPRQAGPAQIIALAGSWVLADLARQFVATGFPWNPLGSVWALPGWFGDVMLQPASFVSVHGLTLATVALACAPVLRWPGRGLCLAILLGWFGFGVARISGPPPPDQPLHVVLVQGNVAQGQKWDRALVNGIFDRYLRLTSDGLRDAGPGPHVVVWPETASPFQLETDAIARAAIAGASRGEPVLAGAVRFDRDDRPRNSLFAVTGAGQIAARYDKWHLVPFGEYQPSWAQVGIQLVPGGGFAPGPGPVTMRLPGVPPVGPLICYEVIFPGQVVDEADRPDWIVNVTNDAWFGTSTGPRQHLAAARLRAVEEGLPLLRAANTGITAAFDAKGHELTRIGMEETGVRTVALPGPLPRTVFARFGLLLPAGVAAGFLVAGLVLSRRVGHY